MVVHKDHELLPHCVSVCCWLFKAVLLPAQCSFWDFLCPLGCPSHFSPTVVLILGRAQRWSINIRLKMVLNIKLSKYLASETEWPTKPRSPLDTVAPAAALSPGERLRPATFLPKDPDTAQQWLRMFCMLVVVPTRVAILQRFCLGILCKKSGHMRETWRWLDVGTHLLQSLQTQ